MSETDNIKDLFNTSGESSEGKTESGKKISEYAGGGDRKVFFYGDAMNDGNINDIVDDTIPYVVILVGFPQYGKSTFVSSLYHAVMTTGAIGKYKFIDSDTILGFERRAYIRNEELRIKKRVDRTPIYADYFLSLLFENTLTGKKVKLILSDRSGEDYLEYGKYQTAIEKDNALRYARHILFFLDAEAAAGEGFLDMQSSLGLLLLRMNKYGVFSDKKYIDIVFNKIDLINDGVKEAYNTNKDAIVQIIKKSTTVNRIQELESLHTPINDDCNKFFEYLLDSCEQPVALTAEVKDKIDWVGKKLKTI